MVQDKLDISSPKQEILSSIVSVTPGVTGRESALGQFVTFHNGTAIITITGLALIHSIIAMSINATVLIYIALPAF
jgi:hypothetical protein